MPTTPRRIFDVRQGVDEERIRRFTITSWASEPITNLSCVAKDNSDLSDATTTVFPTNLPSATTDGSDLISLSPMKSLVEGTKYRVEVKFTAEGQVWELFGFVTGEL